MNFFKFPQPVVAIPYLGEMQAVGAAVMTSRLDQDRLLSSSSL